ncbi:HAD domain-containing protein [Aquimarina sp. 2201CG14-23]|uniref:HAD domain-containing protein n=1 Tax=Aquimarina mycalae TaxID=3040073 RepID=UPI0024781A15|nr:HAD domain-containing protein [Aquimarina sp. 2201CG14-23]MDH7448308.1 HAD domain-containing protein [Aquimarina sp. 2201CG14-23]
MTKPVLILDLDGVLITTPMWKADEIDSDGYSKFNEDCITNLNKLLSKWEFEIWLSSTRRTIKTLAEFNQIFRNRNIKTPISGFLPEYNDCKTRKDEILRFIEEYKISNFLMIDDDKSLNGLEEKYKEKLILTELQKGFDLENLELAIEKVKRT